MTSAPVVRQSGVSLIEALVAMAVMAFGMLGVLGLQATLRSSADLARQRSEAVRIAQETIEQRRAFSALTAASGVASFGQIVTQDLRTIAPTTGNGGNNANTTFTVAETATTLSTSPAQKSLVVKVSWNDRAGQTDWVQLATTIDGVSPALSGSLATSTVGSTVQQPSRRHASVPTSAIDRGDGTSRFNLPGSSPGAGGWIFSNATGLITQICTGASNSSCSDRTALLLSGFVRFSNDTPTTSSSSENPQGPAQTIVMQLETTSPALVTHPLAPFCLVDDTASSRYLPYFCLLPIDNVQSFWSGRSLVTGLSLASSISDPGASLYRVCRYTTTRTQDPVSDALPNSAHPQYYVELNASLANQNFLVVRAGDGSTPNGCPDDDPATPLNGRTWHHQPSS